MSRLIQVPSVYASSICSSCPCHTSHHKLHRLEDQEETSAPMLFSTWRRLQQTASLPMLLALSY